MEEFFGTLVDFMTAHPVASLLGGVGLWLALPGENNPTTTGGKGFVLGQGRRFVTKKHLLSIAPNRSGKGRGLILPNLLDLPDSSVFVIDPKGENALVSARWRQRQGHEVVIFNPYGEKAEAFEQRGFTRFQNFNPLANLDPQGSRFVGDVDNLAHALIYESGGDSHWTDAARNFVRLLLVYLVTEPTETKTLRRLRAIIAGGHPGLTAKGTDGISILVKMKHSSCDLVRQGWPRYEEATGEVLSVISTAETQTALLDDEDILTALDGEPFDFAEMKRRKMAVYLILPGDYLVSRARYLRLLLMAGMGQFLRTESGNHRVTVFLDEFAALGPLPMIEQGFGLIAGYGVTLWPFLQSLVQLQKLYPQSWETFIENAGAVTVSNVNANTTAEYFSKRACRHKVVKISKARGGGTSRGEGTSANLNDRGGGGAGSSQNLGHSRNWSESVQEVDEDALSTAAIIGADRDSLFLFFDGQVTPELVKKAFYDRDSILRKRADENPMHTGAAAD